MAMINGHQIYFSFSSFTNSVDISPEYMSFYIALCDNTDAESALNEWLPGKE
jgi:hypothetical protein